MWDKFDSNDYKNSISNYKKIESNLNKKINSLINSTNSNTNSTNSNDSNNEKRKLDYKEVPKLRIHNLLSTLAELNYSKFELEDMN